MLRKRRPQVSLAPFLTAQIVVGTLLIAPLAAAEHATGAVIQWSPLAVAVVLYVALLPSIAAYYCWDRGVARVGAVVPVYFANLTPLFAALLSTLLLGEPPHLYHAVALLLIIGGIQLASRRPA
jgi:drug/metabolite transporter (DMT)-like permease